MKLSILQRVCLTVLAILVTFVLPAGVFAQLIPMPNPLCDDKMWFVFDGLLNATGVDNGWFMDALLNGAGNEVIGFTVRITDESAPRIAQQLDFFMDGKLDEYYFTKRGLQSLMVNWFGRPVGADTYRVIPDEFDPCNNTGSSPPPALDSSWMRKDIPYYELPVAVIVWGLVGVAAVIAGLFLRRGSKNVSR